MNWLAEQVHRKKIEKEKAGRAIICHSMTYSVYFVLLKKGK
jgi:hypothetical protein